MKCFQPLLLLLLYQGQGHGLRFSSARLRIVNDTVTPDLVAFLFSDEPSGGPVVLRSVSATP